jgi:hypothetical protein
MSKAIINSIAADNAFANLIVFENNKYIAFGNEPNSDLVKIGITSKIKTPSVYRDGQVLTASEANSDGLYGKIHQLYDPSLIGSFRIQSYQVKFIHKTIKVFAATHLKFYGNEDGIFVNFFDVLRSISGARMNRKHETRLLVHQLKNIPVEPFEMTFNAGSFALLPTKSLHIGFGDNKIGIFTDDDNGSMYLLRDPEVQQPVIHSFSDRLQTNISFVLPANPSLLDLDTNQPEHLESEFDSEDF